MASAQLKKRLIRPGWSNDCRFLRKTFLPAHATYFKASGFPFLSGTAASLLTGRKRATTIVIQLIQIMQILLTGKASIYDEIVEAITQYIDLGVLKPGEKLPSVRELATSLSVNPNTVARAYEVLTEKGYLVSLPKKGCFVASKDLDQKGALKAMLEESIEKGLSIEEIRSILDDIEKGEKK
jgi:GntR family transcriptional regulator